MKILIIDDHAITRIGLKIILCELFPSALFDEAANESEAKRCLKNNHYDLCTLDLVLPDADAIDLLKYILLHYPETKVVVISMRPIEFYANEMLQIGARAYISKENGYQEVKHSLQEAIKDRVTFGQPYMGPLLQWNNPFLGLDKREKELVKLLIKGGKSIAIAKTLGIKPNVLSDLKRKIFKQLNVTNMMELYHLTKTYEF